MIVRKNDMLQRTLRTLSILTLLCASLSAMTHTGLSEVATYGLAARNGGGLSLAQNPASTSGRSNAIALTIGYAQEYIFSFADLRATAAVSVPLGKGEIAGGFEAYIVSPVSDIRVTAGYSTLIGEKLQLGIRAGVTFFSIGEETHFTSTYAGLFETETYLAGGILYHALETFSLGGYVENIPIFTSKTAQKDALAFTVGGEYAIEGIPLLRTLRIGFAGTCRVEDVPVVDSSIVLTDSLTDTFDVMAGISFLEAGRSVNMSLAIDYHTDAFTFGYAYTIPLTSGITFGTHALSIGLYF